MSQRSQETTIKASYRVRDLLRNICMHTGEKHYICLERLLEREERRVELQAMRETFQQQKERLRQEYDAQKGTLV